MSQSAPASAPQPVASSSRRRRRIWLAIGATVVLVAALIPMGFALLRTDAVPQGTSGGVVPAPATVTAGEVTVTIGPTALGPDGARFEVILDTHSGDLTVGLSSSAALSVDGTPAAAGTWQGDPSGGHHREGTLTFDTPVTSGDEVTLTIEDLPGPVTASWVAP